MRKISSTMNELEGSKHSGTFAISTSPKIYGELSCAGQSSSVYLRDDEFFDVLNIPDQCIYGVLHDFTKVTLMNCVTTLGLGTHSHGEEKYHFANIFPHFVLFGDHHISPNDKDIAEVHFAIDDATTLFYDFDAFGSLLDARPFIEQIANANGLDREIPIGPDPEILYFAGRREIFATETSLGRISASHNPLHSVGGPDGVQLKNTIVVTIAFKDACTFNDCIDQTLILLRFLELLLGHSQGMKTLTLRTKFHNDRPSFLEVYWSNRPKREPLHENQRPHPADILLDAVDNPNAFSEVLTNWLERQRAWNDARLRFSNSFSQRHQYDIDRLVGAANMFDILPASAVPSDMALSEDLKHSMESCDKIFRALPRSPERDRILGALGRMGKSVLKHKIRHRCQFLTEKVGGRFPDLFTVTDEAVNCRNHYVHGSESKFDYNDKFEQVVFLTDTLEFVFAASDLIEAGWDVKSWCESCASISHPFGLYLENYALNLQQLQALLSKA